MDDPQELFHERRRNGFVVIPAETLCEMTMLIKMMDMDMIHQPADHPKRMMIDRIMVSLNKHVGSNWK
jgi:hypothetical protein